MAPLFETQSIRRAWQIDRALRLSAVPLDRRKNPSSWYSSETIFPTGDDLMVLFWDARVPGSGAPEIPYVEMVESLANQGYDVRQAEALLPEGMQLAQENRRDDLRVLTAKLLAAIHTAPKNPDHPYWQYEYPQSSWEQVVAAMDDPQPHARTEALDSLEEKTLNGWLGQLAGGSFGTAIEGYHSERIAEVYGVIDDYITRPETMNDDVVYELVFLDVFERQGGALTSRQVGLEWVRQIPFGWSAEWMALRNLNMGILPPESGDFRNPFSDWIGAQMRGMICGMLAPGWCLEAARLAYLDGVVSHSRNGVYGEIYAAVLTALAYVHKDIPPLLEEALRYVPQRSEYAAVVRETLAVLRNTPDPVAAWKLLDARFEEYNWIHAYPNIAAVLLALWHSKGDMSTAFRWLAHAGLDVDCNAGLAGAVLGIMHGVPQKWAAPLDDLLETYLRGKERLSIRELAARTTRLAMRHRAASAT
ncbi:MAG: ADP-ribosylglycohydrolase family protein [Anaerolineaceae bacterium]|nr:ADP-ribosylglycohydrolase family protein [Anaerolineaceae bacterium]